METLFQDVRYAVRTFSKNPGFTVVALIALALGIGANTAVFTIVNAVLLRPLPYPRAERVVAVHNVWEEGGFGVSERERLLYGAEKEIFAEFATFWYGSVILTGSGEAERLPVGVVDVSLLPLLGVTPGLGRNFVPEEAVPGQDDAAVLSHALWQRRFGGDPGVVGRSIVLDGSSYTVVGVLPAEFRLPRDFTSPPTQLLVPLAPDPTPDPQNIHYMDALASLAPGVRLEEARAAMRTVAERVKAEIGTLPESYTVELMPLREEIVGDIRPALFILLGAVALVLLIACGNVANLLLARAEMRGREVATRAALGAARGRLFRQLLTESLLLAGIGGGLGLLIAIWGSEALLRLSPANLPRIDEVGPDLRVLLFTAAVSMLTGVIFGILPAMRGARGDLQAVLREADRGSGVSGRAGARRTLVIAEVALAVTLAIGAGLMIRSFANLYDVERGFDPERVLTFRLSLPSTEYGDKRSARRYYDRLLDRLRARPGVAAAGATNQLPLNSDPGDWGVIIEGRPPVGPDEPNPNADWSVVTDGFFASMGIPLVAGRRFGPEDRADRTPVVVINEAMARAYWPGESPVGQRFRFTADVDSVYRTIVGVVANVRHMSLDSEPRRQMFLPHSQFPATASWPVSDMSVTLRATGDPAALGALVRREVRAVDPAVPVAMMRTMNDVLATSTSARRMYVLLFGIFAGLALALVTVGVYGVVAYSVARRTREVGIRMAVGADASDVLTLVIREGLRLTVVGLAIGLGAAFLLARLIETLLFRVGAGDPLTYLVVAGLILAVALLANWLPALRATRIDPMQTLRVE